MEKKKIAILGSTGSIGTQALQVIEEHHDLYEAYVLTANNKVDLLIQQARKFMPEAVVIANAEKYGELRDALSDLPIKVYAGADALCQVVQESPIDIVLTAMVGFSGLQPTISAIKACKKIALANKETLVVAGELINRLATDYRVEILPVDSEHSAIFQCITGEVSPIEKIILTASGGPFRNYTMEQLSYVTKKEALKHPNWDMGAKITIDSATMMNKGFEVIEACHLFNVSTDKIKVLIHRSSIIHSMVEYNDKAVIAQLGASDMRLPIQYAVTYPCREESPCEPLNFAKIGKLSFFEPDRETFPLLAIAEETAKKGGVLPCVMNAANEEAVSLFLNGQIAFSDIPVLVRETLAEYDNIPNPDLIAIEKANVDARQMVKNKI